MTREYFETHSFKNVMEKLYEESTDVTTLDTLKIFIEKTIIKVNIIYQSI